MCSGEEFISADDILLVWQELGDAWTTDFLVDIWPRSKEYSEDEEDEEQEEEEEEEDEGVSVPPKLFSFREVLKSLDDVAAFLDSKNSLHEANEVSHIKD